MRWEWIGSLLIGARKEEAAGRAESALGFVVEGEASFGVSESGTTETSIACSS